MTNARDIDLSIPNFFVLGASKAGSTSLNYYLDQHPQIFMGSDKEPEFFQRDEDYEKGLEWYSETYFGGADFKSPVGEASASYLYYTKVAERLSQLPKYNQRFIVILRDPVERAYSQYWHQVRRGETRTFEEAINDEMSDLKNEVELIYSYPPRSLYLGRSLYYAHLRNYMKYFQRDQFLIIFLDELKSAPQSVFDKICDFLNAPCYNFISTKKVHNMGVTSSMQLKINRLKKTKLYTLFRGLNIRVPKNISTLITKGLASRSGVKNSYPKLSDELATKLNDFFRDDISELKKLLERDAYTPKWFDRFNK